MANPSFRTPARVGQRESVRIVIDRAMFGGQTLNGGCSYPVTPPSDVEFDDRDRAVSSCLLQPIDAASKPLVAVIGVGYVGAHLVEAFSRQYNTLGFDVSQQRVRDLKHTFNGNEFVCLTSSPRDLEPATHFLISVPTPLLPDKSVDTSYLRSALKMVDTNARPGSTVVIESSVAIGMTRELLGPLAKRRGFYAGMSPERIDPGRTDPPAYTIPKIVSGLDDVVPGSLDAIVRFYSAVFDRIVPVSKPEVAEMTKLYENCQRMMCIAYANEMANACSPHQIDPFEVCTAAATKPFGYLPFTPSVGVGGHCIPINPYYLLSNSSFPLLEAASEAMARRPASIAERAIERLAVRGKGLGSGRKPRVLVVGVGFKAGQSTLSNSPGLALMKHLSTSNMVEVQFADPLVKQEAIPQVSRLDDAAWTRQILAGFDMVIVTMRQLGLDFNLLQGLDGVDVEWWCL